MLGVCHACANPLTAHYGITHGVAIGVMLPHVIRFNARRPRRCTLNWLSEAGLPNGRPAAEVLADRVAELSVVAAGLPRR